MAAHSLVDELSHILAEAGNNKLQFVRTSNSLPIGLEYPFRGRNRAIRLLYPASDETHLTVAALARQWERFSLLFRPALHLRYPRNTLVRHGKEYSRSGRQ